MRSVAAPTAIAARRSYESISESRRALADRMALADASSTVFDAYSKYQGDPDTLVALAPATVSPALAELLKGNYSSTSEATRSLKGKIFNNSSGRCCLCGQGSASTLDHYLPKTTFPEFSVLPANLIPACSICNGNKSTRYRAGGAAIYLHCYFDELPAEDRYLFADVRTVAGVLVVDFRVTPPADMSPALARRLCSHFTRLRLRDYYIDEAVDALGEMQLAVEEIRESRGLDGVRDYLHLEARSVANAKGINHWRCALLSALAEHAPYCAGPSA